MRITNTMMTNNILLNINRNRETLSMYEEQLSTGKKIQKPSDDPIVAIRALRFRTNVKEITQFKTNSNDAISWASVTEQAVSNVTDIMKRVREIAVQATSDVMNIDNRKNAITEVEELLEAALNEGNASYAGRHVFSGFKTDIPMVFKQASSEHYQLTESFAAEDIEQVQRVVDPGTGHEIIDVNRIRLGYDGIINADPATLLGAGFTAVNSMSSTDPNAYTPAAGEVNVLEDTGELIFNDADLASIPNPLDFTYEKDNFVKTDLIPEHFFNGTNLTTGLAFTATNDSMNYQISYSQELQVNTLGHDLISVDMQRDIEEMIKATNIIDGNGSLESELKEDLIGDMFNKLLGKMDNHIDMLLNTRSEIGGKINRLELTINRLEEDELNFTDLLSQNEDIDYSEVFIKMSSMETVYNASLSASSKIIQPTLLDFIR